MIGKENKVIKAVIYARFSSDMQREESIDAQVRACKYYANNEKIEIVDIYEDKAKSGTTVKGRDAFLQMIEDSANGTFDMVLVHKLNRFGRDVLDTLNYKKTLAKNGVTLTSVTEKLDGSPEGQLMLMIIAGMNQFYSANLSAEVMKGLKENAHNCKHTGGLPPLGYDVDPITKKLCINEREADCVKLIFKMYLEGAGYTKIVDAINLQGYTSKNGKSLTKHSFNSILKNEKYIGNYIFNKSAKKDLDGKRNGNKYKSRDEWIIVENGCPAIISKEDFETAQANLNNKKKNAGSYRAKEPYLLSGKIICGECGFPYVGNSRNSSSRETLYVSYRCNNRNRINRCGNNEVRRETIEDFVLKKLSELIFDDEKIPYLLDEIYEYFKMKNKNNFDVLKIKQKKIITIEKEIGNIVSVIASSGSTSLLGKLTELETQKAIAEHELEKLKVETQINVPNESEVIELFWKAKQMLSEGSLSTKQKIISRFVNKVIVNKDSIEVILDLGLGIKIEMPQEALKNFPVANNAEPLNCGFDGGEGGI